MYVADRDTYNDFYCGECGNIADHYAKGLCEECYQEHHATPTPQKIRITGIGNALLTSGQGRIYTEKGVGYLVSVNDRNAEKLSRLMKNTPYLIAEFGDNDHVTITDPASFQTDDNTVYATRLE